MTYNDAFKRAIATFLFGVSSAPIPAELFDVDAWKFAAAAGVAAVWNLIIRWAQAYLKEVE
jgi:hypothetical protein